MVDHPSLLHTSYVTHFSRGPNQTVCVPGRPPRSRSRKAAESHDVVVDDTQSEGAIPQILGRAKGLELGVGLSPSLSQKKSKEKTTLKERKEMGAAEEVMVVWSEVFSGTCYTRDQ